MTSPERVLWLDPASFLASAALISLAVPVGKPGTQPIPDAEMRESVAQGLRAGMRFILHDGPIRSIFLSATVLNLLISPLLAVVLPYHARTSWDDPAGLGLVIGAFGAGGVAGAIVYGTWGERTPRRLTFVIGVFAIGGGFAVITVLPPMPLMAVGLLLSGLISGPNGPLINTVLQERTPEHLRGRVFGATNGLCFAAAPIGVLAVGWAIEYAGVQPTLIVMTAIFLSVAVALACDPVLRLMDARELSRPTEPGP